MMTPFKYLFIALTTGALLWASTTHAAVYICIIDNKPVYTTVKQKHCTPSHIDGIMENPIHTFAPPPPISTELTLPHHPKTEPIPAPSSIDDIQRLWQEYEYGSYDRTPILPPTPKPPPIIKPPSPPPTAHRPTPSIQVKTAPTRRTVLQNEIEREQSALRHARDALATARKQHNTNAIRKLETIIQDREQNISALVKEMNR